MASAPPTSPPRGPDELPFEAALERLEEIVDRLEQGGLELEQALEAFETGVRLSRRCAEQLDAAEHRVEILVQEGRDLVTRPFEEPEEPEEPE